MGRQVVRATESNLPMVEELSGGAMPLGPDGRSDFELLHEFLQRLAEVAQGGSVRSGQSRLYILCLLVDARRESGNLMPCAIFFGLLFSPGR